jgi:hypothetical protein
MSKTDPTSIHSMDGYMESGESVARSAKVSTFRQRNQHWMFVATWRAINILLVLSFLSSVFCIGWEFSMRRYLRGFSDAVIPAQGTPEEKIQAILYWMSTGPARLPAGPAAAVSDRDPSATLNYKALLTVCGTATNAFINLADSSGLTARRLLLLDADHRTKHVVSEVLIGNRWIVVDPTFRFIPRGPDGQFLTRVELADPSVLKYATRNLPGYAPNFTYDRTAHIRLSRFGPLGIGLRKVLDTLGNGWEDSATASLFVERESFAAAIASVLLFFLLLIVRGGLRWAAEAWLGLHPRHFRDQVRRAAHAFLETAG